MRVCSVLSHLDVDRSTSTANILFALYAIRMFSAVLTKSGNRTCLSRNQSTLSHYIPLRFNLTFSSNTEIGLPNDLTQPEQTSVWISYCHHACYVSRQCHPPSKTKARCTDNVNTDRAIANTVLRSQGSTVCTRHPWRQTNSYQLPSQ